MRLAKLIPPHLFCPSGPLPSDYTSETTTVDGCGPVSVLPSFMLPRTCLGLLCKWVFRYKGDSHGFEPALRKAFPTCVDALGDLKTGLKFWKELLRAVVAMSEQVGAEDFLNQMLQADKALKDKFQSVGLAYAT